LLLISQLGLTKERSPQLLGQTEELSLTDYLIIINFKMELEMDIESVRQSNADFHISEPIGSRSESIASESSYKYLVSDTPEQKA